MLTLTGNMATLRDEIEEAILEYLLSKSHEDEYLEEDKTGLTDAVFEVLGTRTNNLRKRGGV